MVFKNDIALINNKVPDMTGLKHATTRLRSLLTKLNLLLYILTIIFNLFILYRSIKIKKILKKSFLRSNCFYYSIFLLFKYQHKVDSIIEIYERSHQNFRMQLHLHQSIMRTYGLKIVGMLLVHELSVKCLIIPPPLSAIAYCL